MAETFTCKVCGNEAVGNVFQLRGKCLQCSNSALFDYYAKLTRAQVSAEVEDPNDLKRYLSKQIILMK